MKKIIAFFLIVAVCLSLTSCNLNISSVENLMRPPKLSGESRLLQNAFEKSVHDFDGVVMKTPISGDNRSSYILFDLENDGNQEAIVFYSEPSVNTYANASVFKFVNNNWEFVSKINGKGEEIYEVSFADINHDGNYEIFLSWSGIGVIEKSNSSDFGSGNNRVLTVYSCDGESTSLLTTETYTNLFIDDLNNDKNDEIVLFKINLSDSEKRTTARIMSFYEDYSIKHDEQLVLSGFLEINNIVTDVIENNNESHTRIFVDGAISEIGVITEIIDITHNNFNIKLPLYEQNQSQHPSTLRDSRVYSRDIDNDGIVEIPTNEVLPYGTRISKNSDERKELSLTVWSEFSNYSMKTDFKCLLNSSYNYLLKIPEGSLSKLTAVYDENDLGLTFYSLNRNGTYKEELFSVKIFLTVEWQESHSNYIKLGENDVFTYGYSIFDDDSEETYKKFIRDNFYIIK